MRRRAVLMLALLLAACDQNMAQQKRYTTYEASSLWPDGTSARPLPAGVVAQSEPAYVAAVTTRPAASPAFLCHGREQFDVFCSPATASPATGTDWSCNEASRPRPPITRRAFGRPQPSTSST